MINTCHMHAYLVCSAGLKLKLHICVVAKAFKHLIMCDSRFPFFSLIAIFLRSLGFLPMAPSMVPSSSFTLPQTMPTYIRLQLWSLICSDIFIWLSSFLQTIREPVVSMSMRCTIPGRISPFMPLKESLQWYIMAFTRVRCNARLMGVQPCPLAC